MSVPTIQVTIVSPEAIVFEGQAERVVLPGTMGVFEILPQHAPLIASLSQGKIVCVGAARFETNLSFGFVELKNNHLTVCMVK